MATDNKSSGGSTKSGGSGARPTGSSGDGKTSSAAGAGSASASSGPGKRSVTIDLKADKTTDTSGAKKSGASTTTSTASSAPKASSSSGAAASSSSYSSRSATGSSTGSGSTGAGATGSTSTPASASSGAGRPTSTASSSGGASSSSGSSSGASGAASSGSGGKTPGSPSFSSPPAAEDKGGVGAFGVLVAAVVGGLVVLGGGYGLNQAGILQFAPQMDRQVRLALSSAERKIESLEREIESLGDTVSGQDASSAVSALETKVTSLETRMQEAIAAVPADSSAALEALEKDLEGLRSEIGVFPTTGSGGGETVDLKPLESRLAALEESAKGQATVDLGSVEARLSELESKSTSTSSTAEQLSGSVSGVETEVGDLKKTLSELETRLQNAEATAKAAQTAVSTSDVSLKTLADSQARATETLSSLSADISSVGASNTAALKDIDAELKGLSDRLAQVEATMGDATAREVAARALSVSALKSAVDSGRPYETELAAVRAGLPSDIDLNALESHASEGVEPVSVLIAQFPAVARQMYQTFSEPDRSGDVLDSFLASAKSLVAVRGPGDADGTGPEAALRRMENSVASGDLQAAIEAYGQLPEAAKNAGAEWVAKADARVQVDQLTDKASQEVLSALAAKDS